ncbi:hypothetical protein [Bacillus sp. MCCB 382]|uniref:hypothetical protein n=1 Tax=Bacillus sp. MCCB 382 TaxID=2860197 RepID=UPI001C55DB74
MNELVNNIRDYIHECFDNENRIPSDDEVYLKFRAFEPSEHIIEKEIHFFFDSYYILENTKIEWEGDLSNVDIQVQREVSIGEDAKRFKVS